MDRLTKIRLWHEHVKMHYDGKPSRAHQDREVLLSEIDNLRAEVERLREALRDALDGLRYWVPQTSVGAVEKCRIMEKGIEALEVKSAVERCRFMENGIEALEVNP